MRKKDPEKKSVPLGATIEPDTSEALEERAKETGNRSFIVDKALRLYLGLDKQPELEQKAS